MIDLHLINEVLAGMGIGAGAVVLIAAAVIVIAARIQHRAALPSHRPLRTMGTTSRQAHLVGSVQQGRGCDNCD